MDLDTLQSRSKVYFTDVAPSHDWHHVKRVFTLSVRLSEAEEANKSVVKPAALLHDIGRKKEDCGDITDHAIWGANEAGKILNELNVDNSLIDKIRHCVKAHRYSNDVEPTSLEARILADADNLDALGAVGLARTFSYSGEHDRVLVDAESLSTDGTESAHETGFGHLCTKILSLKDRMYTETGRKIARDRHEYVEDFLVRLKHEVLGQR